MRVFRTILGMLVLTVGLPALLAGAAFWAVMQHRAPSGAFTGDLQRVATSGYAVVVDDFDALLREDAPFVRFGDTRLRLTVNSSGAPAFVGIAPAAEVSRYLTGVPHIGVSSVDLGTGALPLTGKLRPGTITPEQLPGRQGFWLKAGTGQLDWDPTKLRDTNYSLVVMNPAAQPGVRLESTAAIEPGWLNQATWALLILGSMLVMIGMIVLGWPSRRREVVYIVEPSQVPDLMQAIGAPLPLSRTGGGRHAGTHRPRTLADAQARSRPAALTWPPSSSSRAFRRGPAIPMPAMKASDAAPSITSPTAAPAAASSDAASSDAASTVAGSPAGGSPAGGSPASGAPAVASSVAAEPDAAVGADSAQAAGQSATGAVAVAQPAPGKPLNLIATMPAPGSKPEPSPTDLLFGRATDRPARRRTAPQPTDLPIFEASAVGAWVAETAAARARETEARAAAAVSASRKSATGDRPATTGAPDAAAPTESEPGSALMETTPPDYDGVVVGLAVPGTGDAAAVDPSGTEVTAPESETSSAHADEATAPAPVAAVKPREPHAGAGPAADTSRAADKSAPRETSSPSRTPAQGPPTPAPVRSAAPASTTSPASVSKQAPAPAQATASARRGTGPATQPHHMAPDMQVASEELAARPHAAPAAAGSSRKSATDSSDKAPEAPAAGQERGLAAGQEPGSAAGQEPGAAVPQEPGVAAAHGSRPPAAQKTAPAGAKNTGPVVAQKTVSTADARNVTPAPAKPVSPTPVQPTGPAPSKPSAPIPGPSRPVDPDPEPVRAGSGAADTRLSPTAPDSAEPSSQPAETASRVAKQRRTADHPGTTQRPPGRPSTSPTGMPSALPGSADPVTKPDPHIAEQRNAGVRPGRGQQKPEVRADVERKPEDRTLAERKPQVRTDAERKPEVRAEVKQKPEDRADVKQKPEVLVDAEREPEERADVKRKLEERVATGPKTDVRGDAERTTDVRAGTERKQQDHVRAAQPVADFGSTQTAQEPEPAKSKAPQESPRPEAVGELQPAGPAATSPETGSDSTLSRLAGYKAEVTKLLGGDAAARRRRKNTAASSPPVPDSATQERPIKPTRSPRKGDPKG